MLGVLSPHSVAPSGDAPHSPPSACFITKSMVPVCACGYASAQRSSTAIRALRPGPPGHRERDTVGDAKPGVCTALAHRDSASGGFPSLLLPATEWHGHGSTEYHWRGTHIATSTSPCMVGAEPAWGAQCDPVCMCVCCGAWALRVGGEEAAGWLRLFFGVAGVCVCVCELHACLHSWAAVCAQEVHSQSCVYVRPYACVQIHGVGAVCGHAAGGCRLLARFVHVILWVHKLCVHALVCVQVCRLCLRAG